VSLSPNVYFGIWGTALLAWAALSYKYYEKWHEQLETVGDEIRSVNARNGYDQSVGRKDLAKDFRHPFKNQNLVEFAKCNNISTDYYVSELRENIGNPKILFWAVCIHSVGFVISISGITYLAPWKIVPADIYLLIVFGFFAISVALYWYS